MRIAVYGGSFNPPHVVHGQVASWLLSSKIVDEVWLVPVYRHAFEGVHAKRLAPFSDRLRWCEVMAAEIDTRVKVSQVESALPVPSFTIDTLEHLAEAYSEHSFRLVVGADVLDQVDSWRDWAGIQARFAPIVVGREGHRAPEGVPVFPNISSTQVRERVQARTSVTGLVSPGVEALLAQEDPWAQ